MQFWKSAGLKVLECALILLLVLTVLLPLSPANQPFATRDSGVFLYTGWRVTQGEIPYLNVWDHKPPVIFYLNALGLALGGGSVWGVWMIEMASLYCAALIGYFLLKKIFGTYPAVFVSFLWLFTLEYIIAGGNLTTEYTLPMQLGSLGLFYLAEKRRRYGWFGFGLGILTGLAFFTRQNAIGIGVAIVLYILIARLLARQFKALWIDLWPIALGGLVTIAVTAGYFALHHALAAFWDSAFTYNFLYSAERDNVTRLQALAAGLDLLENIGLTQFAFIGWGSSLVWLLFKRDQLEPGLRALLWMTALNLPIELLMVSIGGRPRAPYFMALVPTFALLAGFTFWQIFDFLIRPPVPRLAGAALTFVLLVSLFSAYYSDYSELSQPETELSTGQKVVAYIQARTAPQDTVLMWGAETAVNFFAQRRSPTRFVYQYPLIKAGYVDEAKMLEFYGDILREKPRLIIVTTGSGKLTSSGFGFRSPATTGLFDQVKSLYVARAQIDTWVIYEYSGN